MTAAPAARSRPLQGIAWMILTGIFFVAVTGPVRHLGTEIPAVQGAFIRYVFGTILILPIAIRLWCRPTFTLPKGTEIKLYGLRGLAHGAAVLLWFYAMARISIAEVTAIGYVTPLFTTVAAVIFLREVLRVRRIVALVIGFCGAMIILRPGLQAIEWGAAAQFFATPCFAVSFILAKKLTRTRSAEEIVVMLSIGCMLFLLPGALWQWQTPTATQLAWLALTALFATLGHYTLTRAFACAPLTVTQPIMFLQLIWATMLGYFVFDEKPEPWIILGGAVIVCAITYISHREALATERDNNNSIN